MSANTANRGYTYPQSTDDFRPYEDIQELAQDVDVDVDAIEARVTAIETELGVWTSFTPTLYTQTTATRASLAKTVTRARYLKIGKTVWAYADVLANASSANNASLSLPFAAVAQYICGTALITGTSPPSQSGNAFIHGTLDTVVAIQASTGYTDIISGQRFRYSVCYETS